MSGPVFLDIRSDPGGATVTVGPSHSVRVHAIIKPLLGGYDLNLAQANIRALEKDPPIEQVGNRFRVGYPKNPELLRGVTMHFEIETPAGTEAQVVTKSGRIRIDGIKGPVETRTVSGRTEISNVAAEIKAGGRSGAMIIYDAESHVSVVNRSGGVQLSRIQGEAKTETTSGRIEIKDVVGGVQAMTNSAGISIDDVRGSVIARNGSGMIQALQLGGPVHAQTGSGAIRISQSHPAPIRAIARSGGIKVTLATDAGYRIDAQSGSGKVFCSLGISPAGAKNTHILRGQIGSGGPLVDLDTRSSRIEIN